MIWRVGGEINCFNLKNDCFEKKGPKIKKKYYCFFFLSDNSIWCRFLYFVVTLIAAAFGRGMSWLF